MTDIDTLRADILAHLESIGIGKDKSPSKDQLRAIQDAHRREVMSTLVSRLGLSRLETSLSYIADGEDVDPTAISPYLVKAHADTWQSDLFQTAFASVWSVAAAPGWGRAQRYLVMDRQNKKLIGLFGLCDPARAISARESYIGWDWDQRKDRRVHILSAYIVGAVPPYSMLLGGKLVASLLASREVSDAWIDQYEIPVVLITITSALGRSSIYNRCRLVQDGRRVVDLIHVGSTKGYGDFHLSSDILRRLRPLAADDMSAASGWKIRIMSKAGRKLGLPDLAYHGVQRPMYVLPLIRDVQAYLRGEHDRVEYTTLSVDEISRLALDRWVIPRSIRKPEWKDFKASTLQDKLIADLNLDWQPRLL